MDSNSYSLALSFCNSASRAVTLKLNCFLSCLATTRSSSNLILDSLSAICGLTDPQESSKDSSCIGGLLKFLEGSFELYIHVSMTGVRVDDCILSDCVGR